MKRKITFNIWDYIDIEEVNSLVDDKVDGDNSEIDYEIKKIKKNGDCEILATFIHEKW